MPSLQHTFNMSIECLNRVYNELQKMYYIQRKKCMGLSKAALEEFDNNVRAMHQIEADMHIIDRARIVINRHHEQ